MASGWRFGVGQRGFRNNGCARPTGSRYRRGQFRDYQARLGHTFPYEHYPSELAVLCDQSRKVTVSGVEGAPTIAELAEQIKALKGENAVDAAPQRTEKRQISAEMPVTTRILQREPPGEWERRVSEGEEQKAQRG